MKNLLLTALFVCGVIGCYGMNNGSSNKGDQVTKELNDHLEKMKELHKECEKISATKGDQVERSISNIKNKQRIELKAIVSLLASNIPNEYQEKIASSLADNRLMLKLTMNNLDDKEFFRDSIIDSCYADILLEELLQCKGQSIKNFFDTKDFFRTLVPLITREAAACDFFEKIVEELADEVKLSSLLTNAKDSTDLWDKIRDCINRKIEELSEKK